MSYHYYTSVKRLAALQLRLSQLEGKLKFAVRRGIRHIVLGVIFAIEGLESKIKALTNIKPQNVQTHEQESSLALITQAMATGDFVREAKLPTGNLKKVSDMTIDNERHKAVAVEGLIGQVNRWGNWRTAQVIGWCEYGTRYKVKVFNIDCNDWGSVMYVFPEQFVQANTP